MAERSSDPNWMEQRGMGGRGAPVILGIREGMFQKGKEGTNRNPERERALKQYSTEGRRTETGRMEEQYSTVLW